MKFLFLAAILIVGCAQSPSQTSVAQMGACQTDWYGVETCNVTFADGNPGLVIRNFRNNSSYTCRAGAL